MARKVWDDPPVPMPPYRWVACSIREFDSSGLRRHLATPGALTTVCGYSASHPEVWRANTTKPKCPECAKRES